MPDSLIGVGVLVLLLERADHPGYVYDELGRNTLIPAVDAPNQTNGNITLAYNSTDDVTSINQGSSATTFSYDAETRRLNETNNSVTTTRHYTDSTDNPSWVTQNGSNPKTEVYSPSLGAGLNITTTIQGTTKTADIQLQDLRGNTVTIIDLTTNTATGWNSYDEFGNPHTPTNNTNLINYTTYAKAERATNTTGLILMGARVYNPKTNQFTAPDPITGGNENTYTYPNDPINKSDFTGLWSWWDTLNVALTVAMFIPGLNVVSAAVTAVRVVSVAVRTAKLLAQVGKAIITGKKMNIGIKATETVSRTAGKIWTGAARKIYQTPKGTERWMNAKTNKQYRAFEDKEYGRTVSNFESTRPTGGKWKYDIHIDRKPGSFWNP